jgi:hypothetical protein
MRIQHYISWPLVIGDRQDKEIAIKYNKLNVYKIKYTNIIIVLDITRINNNSSAYITFNTNE